MKTLSQSVLITCMLAILLLCPTEGKSGGRSSVAISVDCTIKGGPSDGSHLLITVKPSIQEVTISGMQGINGPDITITNGVIVLTEFQFPGDRPEMHRREAAHDDRYDFREPLKMGYVQISRPLIEFGYWTWLQAIPNDRSIERRRTVNGPISRFTIDRRTGALRFSYDGTTLTGNCTARKKGDLF